MDIFPISVAVTLRCPRNWDTVTARVTDFLEFTVDRGHRNHRTLTTDSCADSTVENCGIA
jgi:hypothetical protein